MINEWERIIPNEEHLNYRRSSEECEGFDFEKFWSEKKEKLSRKIKEMRFESRNAYI